MNVSGEFQVKLQPLDFYAKGQDGIQPGRMSIDKIYTGLLDATSQGEMLSVRTPVQGSAGYVALEQVVGTLSGRQGSFVLQHYGLMAGGDSELRLQVVPDSATGELKGLTGTMAIHINQGKHSYDFEFEFG